MGLEEPSLSEVKLNADVEIELSEPVSPVSVGPRNIKYIAPKRNKAQNILQVLERA